MTLTPTTSVPPAGLAATPPTGVGGRLARLRTLGRLGGGVGLLVVAAGFLAIAIGSVGITSAEVGGVVYLQAQLPYLLTGGVFGLALVVFGSALVLAQVAREGQARLEARLAVLADLQRDAAQAAGRTPAPQDAAGLVAAGTSSFHRPECRLVASREGVRYLTVAEAGQAGLRACRICQPG